MNTNVVLLIGLAPKVNSPIFFFCGTQDNVGFPLTTQTRFAQ